MRPVSRNVALSNYFIQNLGFGSKNTVASIKGTTKKLSVNYEDARVALYNKANLSPIAIRKPDINGVYHFNGLNNSINCFIVAFDNKKQYNAVIQDGVVPK
ncbi:hypothetical protein F895_02591 [Acinetobacter sp. CIP 64.2]|uniref:hypothetical protein n=1 Tax=Acinetobacter sp. CIP 64.2 TaxID=1217694 RepID=UPI000289E0CE|nr:hypothetical protein [Acinetobacter sp. CIP 64.2]ENX13287.1 hypothetical protein F895_02591 [Acinetobacter sp. CIP 64.2]